MFYSVRDEVSAKCPASKLHYLYFFSDILVVSYVLCCAEPAESDSNGAYSAGAVAARRQNGVAVAHRGRRLEELASMKLDNVSLS